MRPPHRRQLVFAVAGHRVALRMMWLRLGRSWIGLPRLFRVVPLPPGEQNAWYVRLEKFSDDPDDPAVIP